MFVRKEKNVPFRTREDVHICADAGNLDDGEINHTIRCHSHNMEYISSSSPTEPDVFVALRNATVRTLSGEQLPKGQRSGPLCFGDSATGYTVAYYFRLADGHARGKERYYALLALVGTETRRAFESCTLIWNLFEQIALYIINMAEEALQRSKPKLEVDKSEKEYTVTPVSSFLTQRALHPDGNARRGTESVKANNITELVDNSNFFCELHMMFVKMLQELGKVFGGMKTNSRADNTDILHLETGDDTNKSNKVKPDQDNDEDNFRMSPLAQESELSKFPDRSIPRFDMPHHSSLSSSSPSPKHQAVLG